MPFYRIGEPGKDSFAHLNMGRRAGPAICTCDRFPNDNPSNGRWCGRMSVALCDAPRCDRPMCELHRTKHATKGNTDFCPEHKDLANEGREPPIDTRKQ